MITVRIPEALRRYARGKGEVQAEGETAGAAVRDAVRRRPGLAHRVLDERAELHPYLRLYRAGEPIDFATPVHDGDTVEIVAAVAGG